MSARLQAFENRVPANNQLFDGACLLFVHLAAGLVECFLMTLKQHFFPAAVKPIGASALVHSTNSVERTAPMSRKGEHEGGIVS